MVTYRILPWSYQLTLLVPKKEKINVQNVQDGLRGRDRTDDDERRIEGTAGRFKFLGRCERFS